MGSLKRSAPNLAWLAGAALFGIVATAPLGARTGKSELSVGVQAPKPAPHRPAHRPPYPYPYPVPIRSVASCAPDRLLTDTRACGGEAAQALPRPKERCKPDRLLTDTTPCDR